MKKSIVFGFIVVLIVGLSACGDANVLSDDFNVDIEQTLSVIKKAHEQQEDYSENKLDLLDKFNNKYKHGQYYVKKDDSYYEMNDVEKAIYHEIKSMRLFAIKMDYEKETATLASEEAEKTLDELMTIKKIEGLPEEFKDKYPTYEIYSDAYPDKFEKDTNELFHLFGPIVNSYESDVRDKEWNTLINFLDKYNEDNEDYPYDYEQDGKYYLISGLMDGVITMFGDLKEDIEGGTLLGETIDDFNSEKEPFEDFKSDDY